MFLRADAPECFPHPYPERGRSTAAQKPIRSLPLPTSFRGIDRDQENAILRLCRTGSPHRYRDSQSETGLFERELAATVGVPYALAATSGTAALKAALSALDVGPGQEVILPPFLRMSMVSPVVGLGAIPVFADIDNTFAMDIGDLARRITPRTTVIVLTHMFGAPRDLAELLQLARSKQITVIEDCTYCVGGNLNGRSLGTFGDIGIFSFQLNANIGFGEAGAMVTKNEAIFRRALEIRDFGYLSNPVASPNLLEGAARFWNRESRLDEMRAAVLRVELQKLPDSLSRARSSKLRIAEALASMPGLEVHPRPGAGGDGSEFLLTTFETEEIARRVSQRLLWHGIACSVAEGTSALLADYDLHLYSGIHCLGNKVGMDRRGTPWTLALNSESVYDYHKGYCPTADDLFSRTQLLPVPSSLTQEDEQDVVDAFSDALLCSYLDTDPG